jgi:hypothetical protein
VRALLCARCGDVALLPGGHTYFMGRAPHRFPFTFKDARCKKLCVISAKDWNTYPDVPGAVLEQDAKPAPVIARESDWSPPKAS